MTARAEAGEASLAGLLAGAALMIVVLTATLGLFDGVARTIGDGSRRVSTEETARGGIDRVTAALRNLASPSAEQPRVLDLAGPRDLVFTSVDPVGPNAGANAPNTQRVRYCLDGARRLQEQVQRWTTAAVPAVPSVAGCPASGWSRTRVLADGLANGQTPVFDYDATAPGEITSIHVELLVDADPLRAPGATRLASGVYLRNQNRRPTAAFVASRSPGRVLLNGSASADPDGHPLRYAWFDGATTIGGGITLDYAIAAGTSHTIQLRVTDPAGLEAISGGQVVTG